MEERAIFRMDFEGSDKILEQMAKIRDANESIKESQKELSKEAKEGNIEAKKSMEANRVQISRNNKEIRELTKTYDEGTKVNQKNTGSLVEMRKQLRQMVTAYDNLSQEQRENTDVGKQMQKNVADLTKALVDAESATGRNQRSVGDYKNSIEMAAVSIDQKRQKLKDLKKQFDASDPNTQEFRDLRDEINGLTNDIGVLSGEYDEFGNRAKRNPAAEELSTMADSAKGAMSSLAVMNMMLGDSENAAQVQARAVQAMAIAQNAHNIAVGASKLPQTALIVRTKAAATAQWFWNKAVLAFPLTWIIAGIAALTVGIIALVKNFKQVTDWLMFWKKNVEEATVSTAKYTAEQRKLAQILERTNKQLSEKGQQLEFEIKMLSALGANTDIIIAKQRELLELKLQETAAAYEAAIANARATGQQLENQDALLSSWRQAREELLLFDATQKRVQGETAARGKEEMNDRDRERDERKKAEEKEMLDRARRSEKATLELAIIESRSEDDRIAARIELLKWETEQRLDNEELTQAEILLIQAESIEQQLELENILLEKQLAQQRTFDEQQKNDALALDAFEADLVEQKKKRQEEQLEFERKITDARIDTAFNLLYTLQSIAGKESNIAKAAVKLQKALALSEIGINLQRELAAIRLAAATQDAVTLGIGGRIYSAVRTIQALSQAAAGAASVMAFNRGGSVPGSGSSDTVPAMLTPGEGVMRKQAMSSDEVWNLSGTPKQIASRLNQAYGGVEFRNQGGIIGSTTARTSTRNAASELNVESLKDAFRQITIVTSIEDVNAKISSEAIRNEIATYG